MSESDSKLKAALQRLETSTQKILSTRGYTGNAKSLKALEEIMREQLINANNRSAARTIRGYLPVMAVAKGFAQVAT